MYMVNQQIQISIKFILKQISKTQIHFKRIIIVNS